MQQAGVVQDMTVVWVERKVVGAGGVGEKRRQRVEVFYPSTRYKEESSAGLLNREMDRSPHNCGRMSDLS